MRRKHVSIFAWSIGNEVDYPNDPYSHPVLGGEKAGGFTQASYGGYNPDTPDAMRLGTIAKRLVAVVKKYDPSRATTAALDITGYNYTESFYMKDHQKYPHRVIFGSENRHDLAAWKAVRDNEHIFGQFLWTGIDYLSGKLSVATNSEDVRKRIAASVVRDSRTGEIYSETQRDQPAGNHRLGNVVDRQSG